MYQASSGGKKQVPKDINIGKASGIDGIKTGGFKKSEAVTKSDSTVYTEASNALYVGGAGNVKVRTSAGQAVTFTAVAAGTTIPVSVDMVYSTGTTATNMNLLW
tara:strand:- start:258 stop:569 length:312 start_codon:yes stop_codon:yes gene_type:complete